MTKACFISSAGAVMRANSRKPIPDGPPDATAQPISVSPTLRSPMNIELLEARIAPATLLDPTHVRYTDVDGDVVLVSISKGTFDLVSNFTFIRHGLGEQLQRLSLGTDAGEFARAKLTITATRAASG